MHGPREEASRHREVCVDNIGLPTVNASQRGEKAGRTIKAHLVDSAGVGFCTPACFAEYTNAFVILLRAFPSKRSSLHPDLVTTLNERTGNRLSDTSAAAADGGIFVAKREDSHCGLLIEDC